MRQPTFRVLIPVLLGLLLLPRAGRAETPPPLSDYFPPPESQGGWRSLLPDQGEPNAEQKAALAKTGGVDWDKLKEAWDYNAQVDGGSGLLVIRHGYVVGEWYKDGDRERTFNIYSSSKSYTSLAYGLILADWQGKAAPPLPGGKTLTLDTKVCNEEWLPESLPLPDPRKADITVRELLHMASGLGEEGMPEGSNAFEWALGHDAKSPFAKLKADPGKEFHYSNAGVAHLVLLFHRATGADLMPFLKDRIFDPIGMNQVTWKEIGGGKIGPFSQGFSGLMTTPREHARFLWLALHKGEWAGKRLAPEAYYDFAWKGQKIKPDYAGLWWVYPRHKNAPRDMVQTAGAFNNHGYVVPSLDLVFVRLGNGKKFPKDFEDRLVMKVLAAVHAPGGKWEKEIRAFEEADKKSPPPQDAVLFIGSSSTRLWTTLARDFPDYQVINRGFGGSEIADSVAFADRIVIPYRPKLIVLQAGCNDIDAGVTPKQVLADFKAFVEKVRAKLPDTRIAFLSIHPCPARWSEAEKEQEANRLIKGYVQSGKNLDYIDLWDQFLGPDGKPRPDLFRGDRLHNNAAGYKIRADVIRPHLKGAEKR